MGTRWVYRRPFFRVTKPKIPLHRGHIPFLPRRLRAIRRKRHLLARRIVIVLATPVVNAKTMAPVKRPPVRFKPHIQPRVKHILPPDAPFVGKDTILIRMLRAVQRARRHIHARLRWQLLPESVPPVVVPSAPVHAVPRGTVLTAGAVEATIFTAGAKRGRVGGDHG